MRASDEAAMDNGGWLRGFGAATRRLAALVVVLATACGGRGERGGAADAGSDPMPERSSSTSEEARFVDVAADLGLDFVHRTGSREDYFMPAIMGGGAAVFDFDQDDDLDLYIVSSGPGLPASLGRRSATTDEVPGESDGNGSRLFRQEEDGKFVDVTSGSGLVHSGYAMGAAVGDIDNDGDLDLLITQWGPDSLFRNDGNGRFTRISPASGVASDGWSTSAAFLDFDRDGHLDLYVVRYVAYDPTRTCALEGGRRDYCGPAQFPGVSDVLYRNRGDGTFVDVSRGAGLTTVAAPGLGLFCADFDADGWVDVYVANDGEANNLWLNQGNGRFVDDALLLGVAFNHYGVGEAGMGVAAGDGDSDGDLDLFMTHLTGETNTYYENRQPLGFADVTSQIGLAVPSVPYTGFGTALFDYDNDGDLDLAVANGGIKRRSEPLGNEADWFWNDYAEPDQLFENRGDGTFVETSAAAGEFGSSIGVSRGLIPADFNRDGNLDLLVTQIEGPVHLYRNRGGGESTWVEIRALDPGLGGREQLGARVVVVTKERRRVRHFLPAGGYLTSGHPRVHLGLGGERRIEQFEVVWPDGERETFPGGEANRTVELRRGQGEALARAGTAQR